MLVYVNENMILAETSTTEMFLISLEIVTGASIILPRSIIGTIVLFENLMMITNVT